MKLTPNALTVLEKRYLARDASGRLLEDAEGLFRRVASAVSLGDAALEERFYDMMTSLDFLPNSPTLMNAGRPLGQLSACFVLPVADSLPDIFEAVKQAALIHKSGGGTGFSFSRLRPGGSAVQSTGGAASGPVSFMRVFNAATEAVKQGGTRRGANMGVLRADHPDILEFIRCKSDTSQFQNFNISVGLTEGFMRAALNGEEYPLIDPHTLKETGRLDAAGVFSELVDAAWATGEPGILFLDRINRDNPVPSQGEIESTNPCGEQPLLPYESCNLGSVNLKNMVQKGAVDWQKLDLTVRLAVRFLDNVIECNHYPLDKIAETTVSSRKIGLGVMGFADMLLLLGLPYNTAGAAELGGHVMAFIDEKAKAESEVLAAERGPFPLWEQSVLKTPRRNAAVTTIAPTGTISMIAGVSSGIEPVFAFSYTRRVMDGTVLTEWNPILRAVLDEHGAETPAQLPEDVRKPFVSSHDISPEWHIRMQAAFQRHTDNAVSKTVNFPRDASKEQVRQVFLLAYESGCKGVTIYRDGSRAGQVLVAGGPAAEPEDTETAPKKVIVPRSRARVTAGQTERVEIGCGHLYITVNSDENGICEVFTNTGKKGGCPSQSEAAARLASTALRAGVDPDYVIKQLRGIRCPSTLKSGARECTSCPDAIARVLQRIAAPASSAAADGPACPECGAAVTHESGCVICHQCGFSLCK